jgi:hypothetical protein
MEAIIISIMLKGPSIGKFRGYARGVWTKIHGRLLAPLKCETAFDLPPLPHIWHPKKKANPNGSRHWCGSFFSFRKAQCEPLSRLAMGLCTGAKKKRQKGRALRGVGTRYALPPWYRVLFTDASLIHSSRVLTTERG